MVLAAVAFFLAATAYPQEMNVRAHVPFDFVLGNNVYPAGEYALQALTADSFLLCVRNKDEQKSITMVSIPVAPSNPTKQTMLVFRRVGNTYSLHRVWSAESSVGREFPRSPTETRAARNTTSTGTVIVTANIAH
jgi:hypothetical protein